MSDYELKISSGSGWDGTNWLLCLDLKRPLAGSRAETFDPSARSMHVVGSFKRREDAEKAREDIFRSIILQASTMTPSSGRR